MTTTYDPILAVMQRRRARDSFVHSETSNNTITMHPDAARAIIALAERVDVLEQFIRDASTQMSIEGRQQ